MCSVRCAVYGILCKNIVPLRSQLPQQKAQHPAQHSKGDSRMSDSHTSSDHNWDTFDDLPATIRTQNFLHAYLSTKRTSVGIIVRGHASQTFPSDAYWGTAVQLSSHETLQIRMHPKGMFGNTSSRPSPGVIILAARRRGHLGEDQTTLAIIWNDKDTHKCIPYDIASLHRATIKTVAARNLHIMLPSLFNHHEPHWDSKHAKSNWPVLDEQHFHAVRSSSFSIFKAGTLSNGNQNQLINTSSGGLSQFVLAGQFAGVDIQDKPHRAAEPIAYAQWKAVCSQYATQLEKGSKSAFEALNATTSAMAVTDLMSAEGIIGMLSQPTLDGALPDMLHMPGGFPLLITFACRLACYPRRFGLSEPTTEDRWANRELMSIFEANWSAMSPVKAGAKNVYAIDLVIKSAWKDASTHAKSLHFQQATSDYLLFWQRVGQRCIAALWGPTREDFHPGTSVFGHSEKIMCPLAEARSRVMRNTIIENESVVPTDIDVLATKWSSVDISVKRQTLLRLMDSVEAWLRTGQYAGQQVNARNPKIPLRGITKRAKTAMTKSELTEALDLGMEQSVREMIENGDVDSEQQARDAAAMLRDGIQSWINKCSNDDDAVDFSEVAHLCPQLKIKKADTSPQDGHETESAAYQLKLECDLDKDNVCVDAFRGGISCVAAAMCQGPMVHHQFKDLRVYATWEGAQNTCADCDTDVHVLQASFLATRFSECTRCKRARCLNCTEIAASMALKTVGVSVQPVGCLRCRLKESSESGGSKAQFNHATGQVKKKGKSRK